MTMPFKGPAYRPSTGAFFSGLLTVVLVAAATPSWAYFQRWGLGARARGMGEAVLALRDELTVMAYNPAMLATVRQVDVGASFSRLFMGLSDGSQLGEGHIALGLPLPAGTVALWWQGRTLTDLLREDTGTVGYGVEFRDPFVGATHYFGISGTGLRLEHTPTVYTALNTAFTALNVQAYTFDVGWTTVLSPAVSVALAVNAATQPRVSVLNEGVQTPATFRLGVAYRLDEDRFVMTADQELRDKDYALRLGVERWLLDGQVGLRAGSVAAIPRFGTMRMSEFSVGASYRWATEFGELTTDYGFVYPMSGLLGTIGTHRIGVSIRIAPQATRVGQDAAYALKKLELWPAPVFATALGRPLAEELRWLRERLGAEPAHKAYMHRAALVAYALGEVAEAEQWYAKLPSVAPDLEFVSFHALGKLRYEKGEPEADLRAYEEMAKMDPHPAEVDLALGLLRTLHHHDREAVEAYERARRAGAALDPGPLYNEALAAIQSGDLPLAEGLLKELEQQAPEDPYLLDAQGRLAFARGQYQRAVERFGKAGEKQAGQAPPMINRAIALYESRLFEEAYPLFQEAAKTAPEDLRLQGLLEVARKQIIEAQFKEARARASRQELSQALRRYEWILTIQPDEGAAKSQADYLRARIDEQVREHSERARTHQTAQNYIEALKEWRFVLAANPDHEEAKEGIRQARAPVVETARGALALAFDKTRMLEAYSLFVLLGDVEPSSEEAKAGKAEIRQAFLSRAGGLEAQGLLRDARDVLAAFLTAVERDEDFIERRDRLTQAIGARLKKIVDEVKTELKKGDQADLALLRKKLDEGRGVDPEAPEIRDLDDLVNVQRTGRINAHLSKAVGYEAVSDYPRAIKEYEEVLKLDPQHSEAMKRLEDLRGTRIKKESEFYSTAVAADTRLDYKAALESLDRLFKVNANHAQGLQLQKEIRKRLDTTAASQADIKRLIDEGNVAYGQGDNKRAHAKWTEALGLDHYNQKLREKIKSVEEELRPR